ncbi:MAG: hypothetical protein IT338_03895, partial [Thermomicrobiales bacterium]|nr:hypothetical protein [Thermomicrobiales bacterium]
MSAADQATRARRAVPQGARSTGRTAPDHGALAAGLLSAAVVLWIASLRQIDPSGLDDLGIVSILPWTSWAALALLVAGFWLSLAPDLVRSWLPPAFLLGLVLVLHGTPAIAYETLRYSWAWKHVGIVDYIQRHGTIDPNAPYLAANHNWPGFFFVAAWVADFFGLKPLQLASLARFTPVVLNGLYLLVIVEIFRRFTKDWRAVWTACLIFLLGNWVGQDYFSPQGTAYLLYLACIALCVGLLRVVQPGAAEGLIWTLRGFVSRGQPDPPASSAGARALAAIAVLLIAAAIAATHQLTPLVLVAALTGLAVIGWA